MPGLVKLGLWGGNGGNPRDIDGRPTRLEKILLRSGDTIISLGLVYVEDGQTITAGPWGGSNGTATTIEFQPGEYLTEISGTTGPYSNIANLVMSLTFVTNFRTYGPFGVQQGTDFSVPVASGRIVGLYGRTGMNLDAIGLYLMPAS